MLTKNKVFVSHRLKLIGSSRWVSYLALLLCTVCPATLLHASEVHPLVITLVESSGGTYAEPTGRRIVIRNEPIRLFVRIRNTSESAVSIRDRSETVYSFELTDATGLTFVVKMNKRPGDDAAGDIRVYLPPEAERITPVDITRDTWEGVPVLEAGKTRTFTVRVAYETAVKQHIYSEPYTLVLNGAE